MVLSFSTIKCISIFMSILKQLRAGEIRLRNDQTKSGLFIPMLTLSLQTAMTKLSAPVSPHHGPAPIYRIRCVPGEDTRYTTDL